MRNNTGHKVRAGVVAVIFVAAAIVAMGLMRSPNNEVSAQVQRIDGPTLVGAGETIELAIWAEDPEDVEDIEVTVISAQGVRVVRAPIAAGRAQLVLGGSFTNTAGAIRVTAPGVVGPVVHDIDIQPSDASVVELLVESNTLRARSATGVVAVVSDGFGNPVADDSTVELVVTDAVGSERMFETPTRGGLAEFSVVVPPIASKLTIVGSSGQATSSVEFVERLAGDATGIQLRLERPDVTLVADGAAVHTLTSSIVVDSSDQPIAEGTVVQLILEGPDGAGVVTGRVEAGRLRASIMAPSSPGTVTATPLVGQNRGDSLELVFAAAVRPFTAEVRSINGEYSLQIGPVLTWHGGLVPDATPVMVDGQSYALRDGFAVVPHTSDSRPQVSVLGVEGSVQ